jgi:hypothetical protein
MSSSSSSSSIPLESSSAAAAIVLDEPLGSVDSLNKEIVDKEDGKSDLGVKGWKVQALDSQDGRTRVGIVSPSGRWRACFVRYARQFVLARHLVLASVAHQPFRACRSNEVSG